MPAERGLLVVAAEGARATMSPDKALLSGLAGAAALTLVHETARHVVPGAPRVQVIGMRALAKPMRKLGYRPPRRDRLYWLSLIGEVVSNSLWYSMVGALAVGSDTAVARASAAVATSGRT